tara:strand:+ start:35 stop:631 length:597 start_codon:yes stop_codon:yes gene_type:complete
MSKQLANNICHMRNDEIIGLAKNRWLPVNVQMAIAKHYYARAHGYLAMNEGLGKEVRDYLWSDACNKGYALKTDMISYGQYDGEPEKYWELYEKYPGAWSRSGWRMSQAFFGSYWYRSGRHTSATPTDLLNKIYDDRYDPKKHGMPERNNYYYGSDPKYQLERLAKHPNLDLTLAIKLSQCGVDSVQRLGFEKIVELS